MKFLRKIIFYYPSFIILLLCATIISCKNDKITVSEKTIKFNLGFASNRCGTYLNHENDEEWVYFADLSTAKKIKFFDLNGSLKKEIQLDKKRAGLFSASNPIQILSLDTIVIWDRLGSFYIFNSQGVCWKTIDLSNKIIDSLGNYYELLGWISPLKISKDNFTTNLDFRENLKDTQTFDNTADFLANISTKKDRAAYVVNIKHLLDSPQLNFKLYGANYLFGFDSTTYNTNYYGFTDSFLFSCFSNKIFKINEAYQVIDSFTVESTHTPLNLKPLVIKGNELGDQQHLDTAFTTRGFISSIYSNDQYIYVVIFNETPIIDVMNRSCTIVIYSNTAKPQKITEIYLDKSKYYHFYKIVTSKGILVLQNINPLGYEKTYSLFTIND